MQIDNEELLPPQSERRTIDVPQVLSHLPLFLELTTEQLAQIATGTREKRLAKGEMLFQKGDRPRGFFVIVFGQIKLAFPSSQGNEKVVDILGSRQCFGEALMFMDRPYPVLAESLADTLLLHISTKVLFDLLEHDPSFAKRMLAGLSLRLHALMQDVESYSSRSSTQRVIAFLMQYCQTGDDSNGDTTVALPTSKQVIASRINLTPETLSRILHELAETGLISVHGKKIIIHDMKRLSEFN